MYDKSKIIRVPLLERFNKKILKTETCWLWTGAKTVGGYGIIRAELTHQMCGAHRVSYELFKTKVPLGLLVLHKCDVRACVNPEHLFIGTHSDNMHDMLNKSRGNFARGEDAGKSKLTEAAVQVIRKSDASNKYFADLFSVTEGSVRSVRRNVTWKHVRA